jgi:hypothetical protein
MDNNFALLIVMLLRTWSMMLVCATPPNRVQVKNMENGRKQIILKL